MAGSLTELIAIFVTDGYLDRVWHKSEEKVSVSSVIYLSLANEGSGFISYRKAYTNTNEK